VPAAITSSLTIRPSGGRHHVLFDDPAIGSAAFQRGKVDSHLRGQAPGKRRGLDAAVVALPIPAGFNSSPFTGRWRRSRRRGFARRSGLLRRLSFLGDRWGRLRPLGLGLSGLLLLGRRLLGWCRLLSLTAAFADLRDRGSDLGRHALLHQDLQHAVRFSLEVEGCLVGFDLGQDLAGLDLVAALLLPLDDRALLHRVGELRHVYIWHRSTFLRKESSGACPAACRGVGFADAAMRGNHLGFLS